MALRILFTDSGFWKYSWAHLVMSMTESCRWVMQCCLRVRRPRASNKGLRPCPLRTEISPSSFSESFDDVINCEWWDLQSLCNLMLRNVVFKLFHNLFYALTDWRASAHLYFKRRTVTKYIYLSIVLKGIVHPKMKFPSPFTHPQVVPNLY